MKQHKQLIIVRTHTEHTERNKHKIHIKVLGVQNIN